MHLLVNFARSAGVLASLSPNDLSSLVPDGEFFFARETVLVDFSGTHPLMPTLLSSQNAQSAIAKRQVYKMTKYFEHRANSSIPALYLGGRVGTTIVKFESGGTSIIL
jgi:hypothetical protein